MNGYRSLRDAMIAIHAFRLAHLLPWNETEFAHTFAREIVCDASDSEIHREAEAIMGVDETVKTDTGSLRLGLFPDLLFHGSFWAKREAL